MSRRLLIIANPVAAGGRGWESLQRVLPTLRDRRLLGDLVRTTAPGHARALAAAAAPHYDTIVAAGGDGTAREVASGLLETDGCRANLGVLPLGTGNDFAVQTGQPDIRRAVAALEGGNERRLDVIAVRWGNAARPTIDHALLFAATGLAAQVGRKTTPWVKRWFGRRGAYSVGFLRALADLETCQVEADADGRRFSGRFLHVCAGNSALAGGGAMHLSPGARMDDGRLELCLVEGAGRLEVLRNFPKLLRGNFRDHPRVRYFPGRRLSVDATPAADLSLDGDVVGRTPARFEVLPKVLRLLTPAGAGQVGLDSASPGD